MLYRRTYDNVKVTQIYVLVIVACMEILGERLLQDFNAKMNANIIKRCEGSLSWDKFGNLASFKSCNF